MERSIIFEFVYELAFRDATTRKAFPKRDKESKDDFQHRKSNAKKIAKGTVKEYIDHLLDDETNSVNPENYIQQVCKKVGEYGFTFGNAQKLINMAAKYMFIICYGDTTKRDRFQNCHCPMDGIMLQVVKDKGKCKGIPSDYPWSRMKCKEGCVPEEYKLFQEAIRSLCQKDELPIEYDFEQWLSKE